MGNNNNPSYVFLKGTTFYFNRHVPKDVREYYKSNRIILCLKTSRRDKAIRMAKSIAQRLEDYWLSLRLSNMDIPAIHLLKSSSSRNIQVQNDSLSDALELYLKLKGVGKNDTFIRGAKRNIQSVIDVLGDRGLDEYSSSDAAAFRDFLLNKGLTTNSVKRNFATIRSIVNLCIQEHGLDCKNAFSRLYLPNLNDSKKRMPIPIEHIKLIQRLCMSMDDDIRWLVALLSDTGLRLSEATGLHLNDINLTENPHIIVTPHPWRGLKTKDSERQIPLVGTALWAVKRIKANSNSNFAFPRYTTSTKTNANSASAAINKWLQSRVPEGYVIHSFRHSFRDRLREVLCPNELIDQLGGWSTAGVGTKYGKGYPLETSSEWMSKIVADI